MPNLISAKHFKPERSMHCDDTTLGDNLLERNFQRMWEDAGTLHSIAGKVIVSNAAHPVGDSQTAPSKPCTNNLLVRRMHL